MLRSLVVLILSGPAYFLAYQASPTLHFGIGYWDSAFLVDANQFYPPIRMEGPFRHPDNSVEVREFVGRLTKRQVGFQLPYHALKTPLQLHVRCHRFGLQGSVALKVNHHPIEDFIFTKQSYPWGGIRSVIPQEVAEAGPLRIDLLIVGGDTPPSHFPADFGLGVDWIEVTPMSQGVILLPTFAQWFRFFLFLLGGYFFVRFVGAGPRAAPVLMLAMAGLVFVMTVFYPVITPRILAFAWLCFPLGIFALWIAETIDKYSSLPSSLEKES